MPEGTLIHQFDITISGQAAPPELIRNVIEIVVDDSLHLPDMFTLRIHDRNLQWVDSEDIEKHGAGEILADVHGVLIPGGFGNRGIEGKVNAVRYARENKIPFFGICLGLQCRRRSFQRPACTSSVPLPQNQTHPG